MTELGLMRAYCNNGSHSVNSNPATLKNTAEPDAGVDGGKRAAAFRANVLDRRHSAWSLLNKTAIIIHFDLWNTKRGLTLKVHAFLICTTVQDIGVIVTGVKPLIAPTYRHNLPSRKSCDIDDICNRYQLGIISMYLKL